MRVRDKRYGCVDGDVSPEVTSPKGPADRKGKGEISSLGTPRRRDIALLHSSMLNLCPPEGRGDKTLKPLTVE